MAGVHDDAPVLEEADDDRVRCFHMEARDLRDITREAGFEIDGIDEDVNAGLAECEEVSLTVRGGGVDQAAPVSGAR